MSHGHPMAAHPGAWWRGLARRLAALVARLRRFLEHLPGADEEFLA